MSGTGEDTGNSNGVPTTPPDGAGVLANLPRTRPQRSSARRSAARQTRAEAAQAAVSIPASTRAKPKARADAASATAKAARDRRAKPRPDRPDTRATKRSSRIRAVEDPVPLQGFESDGESTRGSVQPPGGTELVASAAELLGEVAKAGLATAERLIKDVISLRPRS